MDEMILLLWRGWDDGRKGRERYLGWGKWNEIIDVLWTFWVKGKQEVEAFVQNG